MKVKTKSYVFAFALDNVACQDVSQIENNENEADVSIGTEIPDLDAADEIEDEIENQEYVHAYEYTNTNEDHLTSSTNVYQADDHGNFRFPSFPLFDSSC